MSNDLFGSRDKLETKYGEYIYYRLSKLEADGFNIKQLPFSIRVLLEAVLRQCDDKQITRQHVTNLAGWKPKPETRSAVSFCPGRVVMQDLTGVPAVVDLAAMRSALSRLSGDPAKISPVIRTDLVIDHSIQVDHYGSPEALEKNVELEFQRNQERYQFLHWAQKSFDNLRVIPPSTGIIHQVNLEFLSNVILTQQENGETIAYPDTLIGTDSHTPMINGIGVVGWGVGGIEAVAAMLGQPLEILTPDVIGVKLHGKLSEGVTPTDLTLTIVQLLREKKVVGKFVEFFGKGLSSLSLADRAMVANMTPESGATITFFPVDTQTLDYLRFTGRSPETLELVEAYCKSQSLFRTDETPDPSYTDVIELDLSSIEPSLAGPRRPQDRLPLFQVKQSFNQALTKSRNEGGFGVTDSETEQLVKTSIDGKPVEMKHGSVVIAAITSCTNTSNPFVMVAAGLLAKNAVAKGLQVPAYVKTSLSPGSRVVTRYLEKAGLLPHLASLGFNLVGYGCTTCIGNSGPLPADTVKAIKDGNLVAAAVLSGNRNFEGRVSPHTLANYLASPPLVVAYALAGTVNIDFANDAIGTDNNGKPVYLKDIWPTNQEINQALTQHISPELFAESYKDVFTSNQKWNEIPSGDSELYQWESASTYLQDPPFFDNLKPNTQPTLNDIKKARALLVLGDSVTTDHISPAGTIPLDSAAAAYLKEKGVCVEDFNTFGSRRGNFEVMVRGTFGNIRLKNQLVPGVEGSYTLHLPTGKQMSVFDAAEKYKEEHTPLIVLAGKEYGTGSSRDWAAKGTLLLGINAVIAESYERIHRSNLVGMGVLPLQFKPGQSIAALKLTGHEKFYIEGINDDLKPGAEIDIRAANDNCEQIHFKVIVRLDTPFEIEHYRNGGILHTALLNSLK